MSKIVGVAQLKARLSEYLRQVRAGDSLTVVDRQTPIARLTPYAPAAELNIRRPPPGSPPLGRIPLPPRLKLDVDAVALLLEDRSAGR